MAEREEVEITHHTWNPWRGCTKISPGCKNCYMFRDQARYGRDPAEVVRTKTWGEPLRWQKKAEAAGRTELVFTCSWSDWFHGDADAWRSEAWAVVRRCPNLVFQVLTKRPERIKEHLPADWGDGYRNVWLGVSVERNDYCRRADVLRTVPARLRWVCAEPLLGTLPDLDLGGIHWLVVGGESGPDWRPLDLAWVRELRDKCAASGVPFYFKQANGLYPGRDAVLDGRRHAEMPVLPSVPLPLFGYAASEGCATALSRASATRHTGEHSEGPAGLSQTRGQTQGGIRHGSKTAWHEAERRRRPGGPGWGCCRRG